MSFQWNWSTIGATLAALAGAAGTILTPIFGASLSTEVAGILQGLSALLLVIPTWHVTSVAASNAKATHLAKVTVQQEREMRMLPQPNPHVARPEAA